MDWDSIIEDGWIVYNRTPKFSVKGLKVQSNPPLHIIKYLETLNIEEPTFMENECASLMAINVKDPVELSIQGELLQLIPKFYSQDYGDKM